MPQEMFNVSIDDIRYAESILLPEGKTFNEERVSFIRNFETIDLQAVPGSGKTTALLAKLLILETKLPLSNNRGVLILSHTNTAIDEIKDKIGRYCPKLFSYPNFVGTIQSFVDQFLAIPYYHIQYGRKIIRIDNEIYNETINKFLSINLNGFTIQEANTAKYFIRSNEGLLYKYRLLFEDGSLKILSGLNKPILTISKPRRGQNPQDFSIEEKSKVEQWMISLKTKILAKGILHFDDAYLLAEIYLHKYSKIKSILQQRFNFIFVDEMQDVDIHQYNLLEKIFYDNNNSLSKYQRIGDKNQAIYTGEVSLEDIWTLRDNGRTKNINGSQRLSRNIAELVNCFALSREGNFNVEGKNDTCNLKPHLLVFNIENIQQVIIRFSELIQTYITSGEILLHTKNKYKVIGWTKEKTNDINKLAIKSYFEDLITENTIQKIDYENLDSYLILFNKEKKTLEPIRKSILNAFIKILRLEGVYFSKSELLNYIEINHYEEYISLNRYLYNWSISIIKGKFVEVYTSIKTYIPDFLTIFNKSIQSSHGFINNTSRIANNQGNQNNQQNTNFNNKLNLHGFDIDISTIHSVKGETHTATLYLETFYQNGNNNYESQRLSDQLKFINFNKTQKYHKQSSKMAYVGFSRPTNLLCFAVCKERFDSHLNDINREKWTIIEI
ncbi:UvrD-helicase domain-containing protein [Chryseobacterium sp.]|jgi:superfamily I DNA/RNA helicase|uniref:UvrD-helicase domain-containing protein n=1 Tax=Chryseobacterium sp. TaxID=1871047 RepID=UPI00284A2F32|nr:UvrD-helicase domain-containing protein [Chryseobacterium sp.]MDR3026607.1 UvrD-helicase domain-containing protein [Chryseobacterium sp.]